MAIGILTGHYTLNRHQIIIGATDSPLCRRCMESEETHTRTYIEVWQINGQIYIYRSSYQHHSRIYWET